MDNRDRAIIRFALRFLQSNLDDEVEETLNNLLNKGGFPSLIEDELEEMEEIFRQDTS